MQGNIHTLKHDTAHGDRHNQRHLLHHGHAIVSPGEDEAVAVDDVADDRMMMMTMTGLVGSWDRGVVGNQ